MSNFLSIESALVNYVKSIDPVTVSSNPGLTLTEKDKPDGMWLQVNNIRGPTIPVTMGNSGQDENYGILQIDIYDKRNRGSGSVLAKADQFASVMKAGASHVHNGAEIKVTACSLDSGRYIGAYYKASLSVEYYSRTNRN